MNKWILYFCFFFPLVGWTQNPSNEVERIEGQIQTLKQSLKQYHLEEMREDVKGQGLMIADWDAYAQDLQAIHKKEEEAKQIESQIKNLEERKARLIDKANRMN